MQLRSIEDVAAGQEVTISYIDIMQPPRIRQARLLRKYSFLCSCDACCPSSNPVPAVGRACISTMRDAAREWALVPEDVSVCAAPPAKDGKGGDGAESRNFVF